VFGGSESRTGFERESFSKLVATGKLSVILNELDLFERRVRGWLCAEVLASKKILKIMLI
jgi:hypothetical protein